METRGRSGFIGILSLLITVSIIGFIFWKMEIEPLTPVATPTPGTGANAGATVDTSSPIQQDMHAIQAAQNVKAKIESRFNQETQAAAN
jgi:hypothetical protein